MPLATALPSPLHHIHVMGVGGTAMAALAGMLKDAGYHVTGSDTAVYPPMSTYLAAMGIAVKSGYVAANLEPRPDLVVVGNVMRADYEESKALLASDIPYVSFPQLLGLRFLASAHSIVIAGTHGKTTTTSIVAWLFEHAGRAPGFLIGGVAKNFDRTARAGAGDYFVVEGDEYDTAFFDKGPKFWHYQPKTAIVTSVEFDHADIYRDLDHVKSAFRKFVGLIPPDGLLVVREDDAGARDISDAAACEVWRYGPGQPWDGRIDRVDTTTGDTTFTVLRDGAEVGTFTSCMAGEHNLYNQVAAVAVAIRHGLSVDEIAGGLASFLGIKRRQEIIGEPGGVTVIDDFAHHPTAVKVTLEALRMRFGRRRLWAIWEPRSATSRRAIFQEAYAAAFDDADQVIVAAPFDQTRIDEEDRFSAEKLVQDMNARGVDAIVLPDADAIAATVAARANPADVVAILSNGGFGGLHTKLLTMLATRFG